MLHRLIALMTILLLLCVPALAEEAATGAVSVYPASGPFSPAPEDFLGTWLLRSAVKEGKLHPPEVIAESSQFSIVISTDSIVSYNAAQMIGSFTYEVEGRTLTASDGAMLLMEAQNVLYGYDAASSISLIFVRSTAPAFSPFYGDWQLLMVYDGGMEMDLPSLADAQIVYRFDAEGYHVMQDGKETGSMPLTYAGDRCTLDFGDESIIFSIDGAGLMRAVPQNENGIMFFIPVSE